MQAPWGSFDVLARVVLTIALVGGLSLSVASNAEAGGHLSKTAARQAGIKLLKNQKLRSHRAVPALKLLKQLRAADIASGPATPTVFHSGIVMHNPHIHTIFWAPAGYSFRSGYISLIQQFFTDVVHDNGSLTNVYSVLNQYRDANGPVNYSLTYSANTDSITDTNPFPTSGQCASPNGVATCLTDGQVTTEIDRIIRTNNLPYSTSDVYFIYLPQNVDTCISPGVCGTNAYEGYHSIANVNGHGTFIYANVIDLGIELPADDFSFPQGNPDAESAIDTSAHESIEAITDPYGTGWMDPNGNEVADKCETGPQLGPILGQAANGADYNQVINGHQYQIQEIWSNADKGCVQNTAATTSSLPLSQVSLSQFRSTVSGNIGRNTSVSVSVVLKRTGARVVKKTTHSNATNGKWSVSLAPFAVGDDRDEIDVSYSGAGAPTNQQILTGNGGNPFTEAGWTGWSALDQNYEIAPNGSAVSIYPCFQTGVLTVKVAGASIAATPNCNTQTDIASVSTKIKSKDTVTVSSNDNRAFSLSSLRSFANTNLNGALVDLTVPLGEPGGGFPTCTADLQAQTVSCGGLVPLSRYTLRRSHGRKVQNVKIATNWAGAFTKAVAGKRLSGGDVIAVRNRSGRTITTLHVAHLRVDLVNNKSVLSSGNCEPGRYYGQRLTASPPTSAQAGGSGGPAGTGVICPLNGKAKGLSASTIAQTDDHSGGLTRTQVPFFSALSPANGGVVQGSFTAFARAAIKGVKNTNRSAKARITLAISQGNHQVFQARNVNTAVGQPVSGLAPGLYSATWRLVDVHGDTRTTTTQFSVNP